MVARHPWAAKRLRAEADEPYDDGPPEQPCHALHREEISEEALVDIWNSVVEERLAHEVERGGVRGDVFVTVLRGGAWTAAHRGVAVDSLRAEGRRQEAALFGRTYSLPKSCAFAFSVYSRADAAWPGRLWCHKMQWMLNRSLERPPPYIFTGEDRMEYREPPRVGYDLVEGPLAVLAQMRLEQIRAMWPSEPLRVG